MQPRPQSGSCAYSDKSSKGSSRTDCRVRMNICHASLDTAPFKLQTRLPSLNRGCHRAARCVTTPSASPSAWLRRECSRGPYISKVGDGRPENLANVGSAIFPVALMLYAGNHPTARRGFRSRRIGPERRKRWPGIATFHVCTVPTLVRL